MEKSRAIELLEHLAWDRDIKRNPYGDALNMAIEALKAQLSCEGTTSDMISRQSVKYLDLFTKTYCRDESATDDLVFRCSDCEFELRPSGKCLVKCMARKLCPDYKDFGSMGDL